MDRISKFLARLSRPRREKVASIIERIASNDLDGLDILPLQGKQGHFRVRTGDIRILYYKTGHNNFVYDADFRGNIYKK